MSESLKELSLQRTNYNLGFLETILKITVYSPNFAGNIGDAKVFT